MKVSIASFVFDIHITTIIIMDTDMAANLKVKACKELKHHL